jgi:argininosuccinate synthase
MDNNLGDQIDSSIIAPGEGKKLVLGFSGGLDTSFCAVYLAKEKNYEVHSVLVNTGGFSKEELAAPESHA